MPLSMVLSGPSMLDGDLTLVLCTNGGQFQLRGDSGAFGTPSSHSVDFASEAKVLNAEVLCPEGTQNECTEIGGAMTELRRSTSRS